MSTIVKSCTWEKMGNDSIFSIDVAIFLVQHRYNDKTWSDYLM